MGSFGDIGRWRGIVERALHRNVGATRSGVKRLFRHVARRGMFPVDHGLDLRNDCQRNRLRAVASQVQTNRRMDAAQALFRRPAQLLPDLRKQDPAAMVRAQQAEIAQFQGQKSANQIFILLKAVGQDGDGIAIRQAQLFEIGGGFVQDKYLLGFRKTRCLRQPRGRALVAQLDRARAF